MLRRNDYIYSSSHHALSFKPAHSLEAVRKLARHLGCKVLGQLLDDTEEELSMQFSQHVLEGTFAEGLNVCMLDCGHLGPLSHRGHDPTRSTCVEKAGSTLCASSCSIRLVAEPNTFQVDGFFGDLFD